MGFAYACIQGKRELHDATASPLHACALTSMIRNSHRDITPLHSVPAESLWELHGRTSWSTSHAQEQVKAGGLQDPRSGEKVDKQLWVTRKGATSAQKGQYGIIPGSMGVGSFITKALPHWPPH